MLPPSITPEITPRPPQIVIVCELPMELSLLANVRGPGYAGRFFHPLTEDFRTTLIKLGLLDAAIPYMTTYPNWETPHIVVTNPTEAALLEALRRIVSHRRQHASFVKTYGTAEQRIRFDLDLLPENELLDILRDIVFDGFDHPRYKRIEDREVQHVRHSCTAAPVSYGTKEVGVKLPAAEFAVLNRIRASAHAATGRDLTELDFTVSPRQQTAWDCTTGISRYSAMVVFKWAGLSVGREYGLDG